jgi:peroxiredoxin
MRRTLATTTVVATAVLLSACSSGDRTEGQAASSPSPMAQAAEPESSPAAESPAASEGQADGTQEAGANAAPAMAAGVPAQFDFTVATVDGGSFSGATLAGQDSVLYFWAPWCTICRREAPALPGIADEFTGQAQFLGVAGLSPDVDAMQQFVADTGTDSLTHLADTDGALYAGFGVASQTTFAFVDEDGTIEIVPGPLSEDEIRSRTQALIGA